MTAQQPARDFLKSEPGVDPILIEGLFRATPERVFRAFTEPEEVSCWFVPRSGGLVSAEIDLRVGGRWCFVIERSAEKQVHFEGEYLAIEAPGRLEFSWRHVQEFADGTREATDTSRVRVTFTRAGNATQVRLRHEAIRTEDARRGVGSGWTRCLGYLVDFVSD